MDIYTDGACKGNPGRGGWGFCVIPIKLSPLVGFTTLKINEMLKDLPVIDLAYGGTYNTTNNIMEMTAMFEALKWVSNNPGEYTLISDSQLVIKGINEWLPGWKSRQFKEIKNQKLWMDISKLCDTLPSLNFVWVKGHAGNLGNELADRLANRGVPNV